MGGVDSGCEGEARGERGGGEERERGAGEERERVNNITIVIPKRI